MTDKIKKSKKILVILLIIEFLILSLCLIIGIKGRGKLSDTIIIDLSKMKSNYAKYSNGKWHIDEDDTKEEVIYLNGPYIKLDKGSYTISVDYKTSSDQVIYAYAKNMINFIKNGEFTLSHSMRHADFNFKVTEDLSNFEVLVNYSGNGSFDISKISISKNNNGWKSLFLWLSFIFFVIDGVLIFYRLSLERKKTLLAIFAITLLSSLPLFFTGINAGHDISFHLMRIEGIANELRYGHFPVRISSAWLGGYGYPVSIYYGDFLLYFPAILRLFGVPVGLTYKIYVFLMNFLTAGVATFFFERMFKNKKISFLAVLIYMTSSYRLTDIYIRSAVGEYSAMLFFPFIAYALWNMYLGNNSGTKKNLINGILFAIGMSGTITTHILSSEMLVVGIFVIAILAFRKTFTRDNIRTYLFAIIFSILFSLYFLVPFLDYYMNENVNITDIVKSVSLIQGQGLGLAEYFSFFQNPFGLSGNMLCTPGIILMITLIFAIILWIKGKASKEIKVLSIFSIIMLFMASNVFPWNRLAYKFRIFDMLAQVQFPWRYVMIAIYSLTILFGLLLKEYYKKLINIKFDKIIITCVFISFVMTCVFTSFYEDNSSRTVFYKSGDVGLFSVGMGEYLRSGTDLGSLSYEFTSNNAKDIKIIDRKGTDFDISLRTDKKAKINAPIFNYKGYTAIDDNGKSYSIVDGKNNVLSFIVPAKFKGVIHIRYSTPWYWTFALLISIIFVFDVIAILWKERKMI